MDPVNSLPSLAAGSLLERPNTPLPIGNFPAGQIPALIVGVSAPRASDAVDVLVRRDGGPVRVFRGLRDGHIGPGLIEWFRMLLPALPSGGHDEYRIEWNRAGRRMATIPADGSWHSLTGVPSSPAPSHAAAAPDAGNWPSQVRFAYGLDFFAALTVNLRAEIVGITPDGYRINFYVVDGRVRGPRIDAVVQPQGGDWMCIRPDGVGDVNIKISYQTSDGAVILEQAGGVFDMGPDGYAKVVAGHFAGSPPFYATPKWYTAHPQWTWLNRCQGIGFGRVVMEKLQVQCDLYLPAVGERTHGG